MVRRMAKKETKKEMVLVRVEKKNLSAFLDKVTMGGEIPLLPVHVENGNLCIGEKGVNTMDHVALTDGWLVVDHDEPVEKKIIDVKLFKDGVDRVDGDMVTLEFGTKYITVRGKKRWKRVPYSTGVADTPSKKVDEIVPMGEENLLFETSADGLKNISKDIKEVYKRDSSGGFLRISHKDGSFVFAVGDLYNTGQWETEIEATDKGGIGKDFVCSYPGAVMSRIFDVLSAPARFYSIVEHLPGFPIVVVEETDDWTVFWAVAPRIEE